VSRELQVQAKVFITESKDVAHIFFVWVATATSPRNEWAGEEGRASQTKSLT